MLLTILQTAGLDAERCAALLGISPRVFAEWVSGQRPIPATYVHFLSDILGVDPSILQFSQRHARVREQDITPAIWYKFRGERLVGADRECVLLIRQLGHFQNQIEEVTGKRAVGWKSLFDAIRKETDSQAPPGEQGRRAAGMLRESTALSHCATGVGEVFRGSLRRLGILVIESSIPESSVEGCSFYVGMHPMERPCVFANTHHSTWFRRNVVLFHEVCHAIFDAPSAAASLDFVGSGNGVEVAEQRAEAFAQEALVPRTVLNHVAQTRGIKWDRVSASDLAVLVAETQVEQGLLVRAAVESGFVEPLDAERLLELDVWPQLRRISERALTTKEYLERLSEATKDRLLLGKRTSTIPDRPLRLPVPYILAVTEAFGEGTISRGKAAQLLMIDEHDFDARFPELVESRADE